MNFDSPFFFVFIRSVHLTCTHKMNIVSQITDIGITFVKQYSKFSTSVITSK